MHARPNGPLWHPLNIKNNEWLALLEDHIFHGRHTMTSSLRVRVRERIQRMLLSNVIVGGPLMRHVRDTHAAHFNRSADG